MAPATSGLEFIADEPYVRGRATTSADPPTALIRAGLLADGATPGDLRQMLARMVADFRDKAPLSAAAAATIILEGVRSGAWRILVGADAKMLDARFAPGPRPLTTTPNFQRGSSNATTTAI